MMSPLDLYGRIEALVDPPTDADRVLLREFADYTRDVLPPGRGAELEARGEFPEAEFRALAARGITRELAPGDQGGQLHWSRVMRLCAAFSAHDSNVVLCLGGTVLGSLPVLVAGAKAHRSTYFDAVIAGEMGGFALSEWGYGSDLLSGATVAAPLDSSGRDAPFASATHFRIDGRKAPINNGGRGACLVVLARAGEPGTIFSHSLFLVRRGTPGLRVGERFASIGYRCMDLAEVVFEGCVVGRDALMGEVGDGFVHARRSLEISRSGVAVLALGPLAAALSHAYGHAQERRLYGATVADLAGARALLARSFARACVAVAVGRRTARAVTRWAASTPPWTSAAKFITPVLLEETIADTGTLLGARSLIESLPFASLRRMAPLLAIFDGSSQLQLAELWRHVAAWGEEGSLSRDEAMTLARDLAEPAPEDLFDPHRRDHGEVGKLSPPAMLSVFAPLLPSLGLGAWARAAGLLRLFSAEARGAPQDILFQLSRAAAVLFAITSLAEAIVIAPEGSLRRQAMTAALGLYAAEIAASVAAILVELGAQWPGVAIGDAASALLSSVVGLAHAREEAYVALKRLVETESVELFRES